MRIKSSVMLGILLSFMTLCAVRADSIVTSKSYVDAQDALKQNKIPVSGTNVHIQGDSIITYTNAEGQIGERELITEPDMLYDMTDGHIEYPGSPAIPTAGAVSTILQGLGTRLGQVEETVYEIADEMDPFNTNFQTKIPAQSPGWVVTYNGADAYGQSQFGKLDVYQPNPDYPYNAGTDADKLATMGAVMASMASSGSQPALSGTNGAVVTYTNTPGVTGERHFLSGQYWSDPSGNEDKLVTASQISNTVKYIGNRPVSIMECTDPFASDDECLLWHISQRRILSAEEMHVYTSTPFINSEDYPSYPHYPPYNP